MAFERRFAFTSGGMLVCRYLPSRSVVFDIDIHVESLQNWDRIFYRRIIHS